MNKFELIPKMTFWWRFLYVLIKFEKITIVVRTNPVTFLFISVCNETLVDINKDTYNNIDKSHQISLLDESNQPWTEGGVFDTTGAGLTWTPSTKRVRIQIFKYSQTYFDTALLCEHTCLSRTPWKAVLHHSYSAHGTSI